MEAAANNMLLEEDSSVFMQWAMDTLLQDPEPEPEPVHALALNVDVDLDDGFAGCDGDGDGEAVVFPSLQALRDASHAAEMVRELMDAAASSWTTSGSGSGSGDGDGAGEIADGGTISTSVGAGATTDPAPAAALAAAATDYYGGSCYGGLQSPNSPFARAPPPPPPSSGNTSSLPAVSWNFVTGSAQPGSDDAVLEEATAAVPIPIPTRSCLPPELVQAQRRRSSPPPAPPRRAHHLRSTATGGPLSSASCTPDHIVAERKRGEKINKRLIELSTVIPGLKKMDKATILTDAAKYVKELQQRLKALEQSSSMRSKGSPSSAPTTDENNGGSGSPTSASSSSGAPAAAAALPEIDARFSERSAMVRIHCGGGKGVAAAALTVVEGLGLTVVHANVMPFSACTIVITITAEMEGRLTLTTEQIVGKLKSALYQCSSCKDTEETEN